MITSQYAIMYYLQADLPSAQQHINAVLAARPHDAAVAVSAATERQLQQMRRAGHIHYIDAADTASNSSSSGDVLVALQHIAQNVLQPYGSTGVLAALTCAVALKPPRWVFPIADRETCAALAAVTSRAAASGGGGSNSGHHHSSSSKGRAAVSASSALGWGVDAKARAAQGSSAGVLRDCILLKPGSRVEDVYQVLKRPPYGLLEGEFVRAECRVLEPACARGHNSSSSSSMSTGMHGALDHVGQQQQEHGEPVGGAAGHHSRVQCRVVRKDELVGPSNCVLLLQTNRKVSWQAGTAARRH